VRQPHGRDERHPEQLRRLNPAVTRNDLKIVVDQHRIQNPNLSMLFAILRICRFE
jgi:hypothetical protein